MGSTTKSRKVKRNRGKKFVWNGNQKAKEEEETANLFEEMARKKFKGVMGEKDLEKRQGLVNEFRNRGKNSEFIDKRIAERATGMTEDDKMKLRYLKEQRDQAKASSTGAFTSSRRKTKFNLSESGSDAGDEVYMGFTHKGRPLEAEDDFNEHIDNSESSDDVDDNGMRRKKGQLPAEVVDNLNFGVGADEPERKKTRKEVFEEIIEKSRAFDAARRQVKDINLELCKELDNDFGDIVKGLNFEKQKPRDPKDQLTKEYGLLLETVQAGLHMTAKPTKEHMSQHEEAIEAKKKLRKQAEVEHEEEEAPIRKRDKKVMDKREIAQEREIMARKEAVKDETKANTALNAMQDVLKGIEKKKYDSDLDSASEKDAEEDDNEEDYDEEEGEEESNSD